jgi:hypothetical protein
MKYEEMSEILGTSVGALKASYHHAVKKIEAYFHEEIPDYLLMKIKISLNLLELQWSNE